MSDTTELLRIPQRLTDLADEIKLRRLTHRKKLSIADYQLLVSSESSIRGQANAIGALISESIIKDIKPKLKELEGAISEMDDLLEDISKLKQILLVSSKVIQLGADALTLITRPLLPPV